MEGNGARPLCDLRLRDQGVPYVVADLRRKAIDEANAEGYTVVVGHRRAVSGVGALRGCARLLAIKNDDGGDLRG